MFYIIIIIIYQFAEIKIHLLNLINWKINQLNLITF